MDIGIISVLASVDGRSAVFIQGDKLRDAVVKVSAAAIAMLSLFVAFTYFGNKVVFRLGDSFLAQGAILVDILVALAVFYYTCVRFHRYWIALLEVVQLGAVLWFEYVSHGTLDYYADIVVDNFTLIMILIAGVIGSLIAVFLWGTWRPFKRNIVMFVTEGIFSFSSCFFSFLPCSDWLFPIIFYICIPSGKSPASVLFFSSAIRNPVWL